MRSLPRSASGTRVGAAEGSLRGVLPRVVREVALAAVAVAAVIVLTGLPPVLAGVPVDHLVLLFGVSNAVFAAMAAILAALAGRLMDDHHLGWLSATFAFYGLVGVPATATSWMVDPIHPSATAGRMTACAVASGLLCVAVRPPARNWAGGRWMVAGCGLLLTGVASLAGRAHPAQVEAVTSWIPLRLLLPLATIATGGWLAVLGWRRGTALSKVGVGFAVMGLSRLGLVFAHTGWIGATGLTFSALRLLSMVFALVGLIQVTYAMLRSVHERQSEHQEQLRLAQLNLDRVAERDHELRNGLAGLAGVTDALVGVPVGEKDELRSAVAAELARLGALLGGAAQGTARAEAYPLRPVLRDVALLWRTTGMTIQLDADPGLRAEGSPDTLAQVLTNVVANCARHAPGSPVRVQAVRCGRWVRLRISDSGPGLGALSEQVVFDRRVCNRATDGQGLGLYICRKLVAQDGGTIRMLPALHGHVGCTVVVELPAAGASSPRRAGSPVVSGAV